MGTYICICACLGKHSPLSSTHSYTSEHMSSDSSSSGSDEVRCSNTKAHLKSKFDFPLLCSHCSPLQSLSPMGKVKCALIVGSHFRLSTKRCVDQCRRRINVQTNGISFDSAVKFEVNSHEYKSQNFHHIKTLALLSSYSRDTSQNWQQRR